jgi:hypothetical protein
MKARTNSKSVHWVLLAALALSPTAALAQEKKAEGAQTKTEAAQPPTEAPKQTEEPQTKTDDPKQPEDPKLISVPGGKALGMSILGNQEAPKALVIVPWKTSELGNAMGISPLLDDSRQPIDKEVFMRMLSYYEIRSGTSPTSAPPEKNSAPAPAAQRRK